MAEVPEHLLRRSRERRKALGLPVPGEEGGEAAEAPAAEEPAAEGPAAEAPAAEAGGEAPAAESRPTGDASSKIPAHLLARSAARKAAKGGDAPAAPAAGGAQ
ncbi:MAG: hypothetical protein ACRDZ7_08325, partial [Acidimicrobiia bacterium]